MCEIDETDVILEYEYYGISVDKGGLDSPNYKVQLVPLKKLFSNFTQLNLQV